MKTRWIVILSIIGVLVILRLIAPYLLLQRVNNKLAEIEGYDGVVEDVDLALYRGAFILDSVHFTKSGANFSEPFMAVEEVEILLNLNALFRKGKLYADITIPNAEINFIIKWADKEAGKKIKQVGEGVKWLETFREMSPFEINTLEITNSKISYINSTTDPETSAWLSNIQIHGSNLQNVENKDESLPGDLNMSAVTMGGGALDFTSAIDIIHEPMDLNSNLVIEGMEMAEWNEFMKVHSGLDFETGVFNLYSEVIVSNGSIDGYIKPVMDNVSLLEWKEEEGGFFDKAWEAIAGGITEIFENQKEDQLASRVPLSGNLEEVDADYWTAIWNVFRNAFIDAFDKELEHTINPDED